MGRWQGRRVAGHPGYPHWVASHADLGSFGSQKIDHGIMFGLVPGHGGSSEADISFRLGKKYDRLTGTLYANGGSSSTSPVVEIQDASNRTKPPRELFSGQADQSG